MPPELAIQLVRAAAEAGTSVSSWLAEAAARRGHVRCSRGADASDLAHIERLVTACPQNLVIEVI
ncbi:MAG: hypothetical protein ACRDSF_12785 [Pseudonocardiaceae bacterium]